MLLLTDWLKCIVLFLIAPVLMGGGFLSVLLKGKRLQGTGPVRLACAFSAGWMFIWALTEVLALPLTIRKVRFSVLFWILFALLSIFLLLGIFYRIRDFREFRQEKKTRIQTCGYDTGSPDGWFSGIRNMERRDRTVFFISTAVILAELFYILYENIFLMSENADDSRFVVLAVDYLRTDKMLLTEPTTGLPLGTNYRDFSKDIISHWAAYLAAGAKISGLPVTVFAHTVYPALAVLLMAGIYSLLVREIFPDVLRQQTFMILILLLHIFGYYSIYNAETFLLTRSWQGKATLAGVGLPVMLLCFLLIYRYYDNMNREKQKMQKIRRHEVLDGIAEPDGPGQTAAPLWVMLMATNISCCLMSAMGVVLTALFIGAYGIVTAIAVRKVRVLFLSAAAAIPNVILYVLSVRYTIGMYLG